LAESDPRRKLTVGCRRLHKCGKTDRPEDLVPPGEIRIATKKKKTMSPHPSSETQKKSKSKPNPQKESGGRKNGGPGVQLEVLERKKNSDSKFPYKLIWYKTN